MLSDKLTRTLLCAVPLNVAINPPSISSIDLQPLLQPIQGIGWSITENHAIK